MATVSLVMPMYNEAANIDDVLASLSAQTFPHSAMRLIVIDGHSADGGRERVEAWLAGGDIRGEALLNPQRTIPTSLNIGIKRVPAGDFIIRLDAHTIYEPGYVSAIMTAFSKLPETVGCVGGSTVPEPETTFSRALVVALYNNPLGLGGAEFRRKSEPRPARSVYLGAWRPGVLQRAGGYDERWEANEDGELAARLRARGWELYLLPLQAAYRVKRTPAAVVRLWGHYGFWRAQTLRRHPGEWQIRHFVPPVALALGLALLATPFRAVDAVLFVLYAAAIFAKRAPGESFAVTLASCVFSPACQVAWSIGLLRGLLRPRGVGASTTWPGSLNPATLDTAS
jgi:glycosyltransferase involved in cell wall biosynthesis